MLGEIKENFKRDLIKLCVKYRVDLNINYMNQICDIEKCYAIVNDDDDCYELTGIKAMKKHVNDLE